MLVVHGGAGRLPAAADDLERLEQVRGGLRDALQAGGVRLDAGGDALDAAVAAVRELERCEAFNAGRGGVLDADGAIGLDAAVMDGATRAAGGVVGVRRVAQPVDAALAVLRDGRHVLLAGEGAERFAVEQGLETVDPSHHVTPRRVAQLEKLRAARPEGGGTVGAVALDARGRLAAATSTGGLVARRPGRVSDSALIGAGTWADARCAVSATGYGESFIRAAFAHQVAARVGLAGETLEAACAAALADVSALGGSGGCIALDAEGRIALPYDTPHMPRGVRAGDARLRIAAHEAEL